MDLFNHQDFDAAVAINDFLVRFSSKSVECLIEIFLEDIKATVTTKIDFEYRDQTALQASFELFGRRKL